MLGTSVLPILINFYLKTIRITKNNQPAADKNYIFIFWHSRMLAGWWIFKNRNYSALVSQSKDGEILTKILTNWNYNVVRGSSSKGGKEALKEIIEIAKLNRSVVITPDGPRGPAGEMKNGAFIISHESKVPLIPVKIFYKHKLILKKSWDKFEVPLPFSKCEVSFGNEHLYENYLDDENLKTLKKNISSEM